MRNRVFMPRISPVLFMCFALAVGFDAAAQRKPPLPRMKFSGFDWVVRTSEVSEGPRDNLFGGRDVSVFAENGGSLVLKITEDEGAWKAAEVYYPHRFGYGTYLFRISTPLADLDPNVVLGLFTYSSQRAYNNREIDIEFSAWGEKTDLPTLGQFVVQPYDDAGHMNSFPVTAFTGPSSHAFTWLEDRVEFASWTGLGPRPAEGDPSLVASWTFVGAKAVPKPGNEAVHMNLYLADGNSPPAGKGRTSVTIESFSFAPAQK
ncbi:MAG: hypothetical protein WAZ31_11200 [Rectinemataceae bacterium]